MKQFNAGDRVRVVDPGLSRLNEIMGVDDADATNNIGAVASDEQGQDIYGNDTILINFDDGGSAPYPVDDVQLLVVYPKEAENG